MRLVALAALALVAFPVLAEDEARAPVSAARGPDVVTFRFGWPDAVEAQAIQRRTRIRTGSPRVQTVTRFTQRAERKDGEFRIATRDTSWEGALPYDGPRPVVSEILAASDAVVQVVSAEGELVDLEGVGAMRAPLEKLLQGASLPPAQVERALDAAAAAVSAQARELWNLGVGFWAGATLALGERYAMRSVAESPLLPGATVDYDQEFQVRRRVPCTAREKEARCVEVTLRATPDPAALPKLTGGVVERLVGAETRLAADAVREVAIEDELYLVTEPATLLPHRLAWTRSARVTLAGAAEGDPARVLESVDRTEYDYRYGAPRKPPRKVKRNAPRS